MKWKREGDVVEGGDVGGDYQCSDSWMVRYRGEDPTRTIDVYFFGEVPLTGYTVGEYDGPYYNITRMTWPTICRDPAQAPGDTEVWSDSDYFEIRTDVRIDGEPVKILNEMCQRIAGEHTAADVGWDGTREGWTG
jgi:hypothetical protein